MGRKHRANLTGQTTVDDLINRAIDLVEVDPIVDDVVDLATDELYEIAKRQLRVRLGQKTQHTADNE